MPLGLMYVFRLLYAIKCFRVMGCCQDVVGTLSKNIIHYNCL
jgi:hypothetical protein